MDCLEEDLKCLNLINNLPKGHVSHELPIHTAKDELHLEDATNNLSANENGKSHPTFLHAAALNKISGPLVPPKPSKKPPNEYAKLCSNIPEENRSGGTITGSAPLLTLLHRKKSLYDIQNCHQPTTTSVTLDNPAVLEQQLEVLAHHKRQLEKKGLLQTASVPKLSSTSLANSGNDVLYANLRPPSSVRKIEANDSKRIYSNVCAQRKYFENLSGEEKANMGAATNSAENKLHNKMYSNILTEDLTDLRISLPTSSNLPFASIDAHTGLDRQDDDMLPPASPVSSSYSELRRATDVFAMDKLTNSLDEPQILNTTSAKNNCNAPQGSKATYSNLKASKDFIAYTPNFQSSSTYESIYEPINPRPPSQLSSRSTYLNYSPYTSATHSQLPDMGSSSTLNSNLNLYPLDDSEENHGDMDLYTTSGSMQSDKGHSVGKMKSETDTLSLTDFLVHSLSSDARSSDVDNYGICFKCNGRVVGETSGCTAMNQIYHINCFTCSQCQINLQGKPFYAVEGKPFCEYDYLQTLEKCSVCMKPILERILRATGKPYHPQCFTCIVCGKSLDGIPFTVDATNQNYCIEDFHKKFAPRCCVCKKPIMPEPGEEETVRVVALDRSFHFECYKCEDCGLLLSSEAEGRGCYPLDDHVLCKSCNAKRVQMLTNHITTQL